MGLSSLEVHLGLSLLGSPSVFDKSWRGGVVMGQFTTELGRMGSFTCGPIGRGSFTRILAWDMIKLFYVTINFLEFCKERVTLNVCTCDFRKKYHV